jgi:hypothetical protein
VVIIVCVRDPGGGFAAPVDFEEMGNGLGLSGMNPRPAGHTVSKAGMGGAKG